MGAIKIKIIELMGHNNNLPRSIIQMLLRGESCPANFKSLPMWGSHRVFLKTTLITLDSEIS